MGNLVTLTEAEKILGITRKTLLKHIARAGIQVRFDRHDQRKKLLDDGQIAQLQEVVQRMSKKKDNQR